MCCYPYLLAQSPLSSPNQRVTQGNSSKTYSAASLAGAVSTATASTALSTAASSHYDGLLVWFGFGEDLEKVVENSSSFV